MTLRHNRDGRIIRATPLAYVITGLIALFVVVFSIWILVNHAQRNPRIELPAPSSVVDQTAEGAVLL